MKWFDVNDHIGNPVEFFTNQKPRFCGELVRILDAHVRVHFEMKLDVILKASFTGVDLLDAFDAGRTRRRIPPD